MQKVLAVKRFTAYALGMTDQLLITAIATVASIPFISATFLLIEKNKQNKQMHIHEQTAKKIDALIEKTKGKFFTLTFIKQDGTLRTINGKDKYNRLIVGTGSPATDALKAKGYKNAVNRNRESWVSFMPEKVVEFKCGAIHETF